MGLVETCFTLSSEEAIDDNIIAPFAFMFCAVLLVHALLTALTPLAFEAFAAEWEA